MAKAKILLVEDERIVAKDIRRTLENLGYKVCSVVSTGEETIKKVETNHPDLVLMDIALRGEMDGIKTAEQIRARFDIPVVYLTAYADKHMLERAKVTEPFGYIIKPFEERELHTTIEMALYKYKVEKELEESFDKLRKSLEQTVSALASAVEMRDPFTAGHQRRVAQLTRAIAKEMDFSKDMIKGISVAAIIHDVGKLYVPAEILSKPSRLTEAEFDIVKSHSKIGYEILKSIDFPWPIANVVLQHHERLNGSGYPQGFKDGKILAGAKIIAVADVVEAMSSHRPYRPAHSIETTLEYMLKNKSSLFEPDIVDVCFRLFYEKEFGFG